MFDILRWLLLSLLVGCSFIGALLGIAYLFSISMWFAVPVLLGLAALLGWAMKFSR